MNEKANRIITRQLAYGFQHLLTLFSSIVVTSAACGLSMPVCLFTGGLGTIVFHLCTKGMVPVFTGASTAFVAPIAAVVMTSADAGGNAVRDPTRVPYATGAIVLVGVMYCIFALVAYFIGPERLKKLFPPIVTGPVIMIIGCKLAAKACTQAGQNWIVAVIALVVVLLVSHFGKGFLKSIPFLIGIAAGYLAAFILDKVTGSSLISFAALENAPWIQPFWSFSGDFFVLPKFDLDAILLITPVAFVTGMEHIGDITTNGAVVGKDFLKDPGLHRTLLGDGLSTLAAGLLGGNSTTTFSQNTGLLAITGIYDPQVLRIAAVMAMILAVIGKVAGFVATIPTAVIGGISIVLFGSIAGVGVRNLAENKVDFSRTENIFIIAVVLVLGLGMSSGVRIGRYTMSSLFIAVIAAVLMNLLLNRKAGKQK